MILKLAGCLEMFLNRTPRCTEILFCGCGLKSFSPLKGTKSKKTWVQQRRNFYQTGLVVEVLFRVRVEPYLPIDLKSFGFYVIAFRPG